MSAADRDAEVEALRAALKPFAEFAERYDDPQGGSSFLGDDLTQLDLNLVDFRRARAALATPSTAVVRDVRAVLPRLTEAMMRAACKAHYGEDNIDGISMTSRGIDYNFRQAFQRMWRGIRAELARHPEQEVKQ